MTEKRYVIIETRNGDKFEKVLPAWLTEENAKSCARISRAYLTKDDKGTIELAQMDYNLETRTVNYDSYKPIDF